MNQKFKKITQSVLAKSTRYNDARKSQPIEADLNADLPDEANSEPRTEGFKAMSSQGAIAKQTSAIRIKNNAEGLDKGETITGEDCSRNDTSVMK